MAGSFIRWETRSGEPLAAAGWQILPISRALVINPRRVPVGWVWNRPSAIAVTGADGQEYILPIYNETRRRLLFWLGAGLIGSLLMWSMFRLLRRK